MNTEQTRSLIARYYEALTTGDSKTVKDCLADEVVWQLPQSVTTVPSDENRQVFGEEVAAELGGRTVKNNFDLSKPFNLEIRNIIVDGGMAVVQQRLLATAKATGSDYDNQYCWVYTCEDDKIVRMEEYADTLYAARSMGQELKATQ
ncbi:MAG: nuclear transport factor 2 family protein [Actinomycetota bacterium]|jgi:ketosteroid isomerase-like protein|nr:nuclear transport factor 2 family protein [Acidimicrobiales bacterium]